MQIKAVAICVTTKLLYPNSVFALPMQEDHEAKNADCSSSLSAAASASSASYLAQPSQLALPYDVVCILILN